MTTTKEHTIDASGKSVGRIASEAAKLLMGKDSPAYQRHIAADVSVRITNASQAKVHVKKPRQKTYKTYSGYPGGLKETSMEKLVEKKGYSEIFRKAIYGMLPGNRLRAIRMKRLSVSE